MSPKTIDIPRPLRPAEKRLLAVLLTARPTPIDTPDLAFKADIRRKAIMRIVRSLQDMGLVTLAMGDVTAPDDFGWALTEHGAGIATSLT